MYNRSVKRKRYEGLLSAGYSYSYIAKKMNVGRQAVQMYVRRHGLEDISARATINAPETIRELTEKISWHLKSAKALESLAERLISQVELVTLENAQKLTSKLIAEMQNGIFSPEVFRQHS